MYGVYQKINKGIQKFFKVFYMFISKKMLFIFKAKISASIARPLPDGLE